jgi:hypothetical protein
VLQFESELALRVHRNGATCLRDWSIRGHKILRYLNNKQADPARHVMVSQKSCSVHQVSVTHILPKWRFSVKTRILEPTIQISLVDELLGVRKDNLYCSQINCIVTTTQWNSRELYIK